MSTDTGERDNDTLAKLIVGLRNNEAWASAQVYQQYGPVLRQIAEGKIESILRRRIDADDVLQSAFRTFFRRMQQGQFEVDDVTQLWNLLCAITLTKVREQARFHLRERRAVDREQQQFKTGSVRGQMLPAEPAVSSGIVYQDVDFADQIEKLMQSLDKEEFSIVGMKLCEQTNQEIAQQMRMSERTVRRILARVRGRFERELSHSPT